MTKNMKVLIIGAGVLGSYLAHELVLGKVNVSILARGTRLTDLKKHGLVIHHVRQKNDTVDFIEVVDSLKPNDAYDVIFVVLQKSQINDVLPMFSILKKCTYIVFIGNNFNSEETYKAMNNNISINHSVLFGFLSCAGHRDAHVVYNWHKSKSSVTLGSPDNDKDAIFTVCKLFSSTNLSPDIKQSINSWLKYHGALITPICLAIQYEKIMDQRLRKSLVLQLAIDAYKEYFALLEAHGLVNEYPHNIKFLKAPTWLLRWGIAKLLPTKTGHYIAVDHALSAKEEIKVLTDELISYSNELGKRIVSLEKLIALSEELI